MLKKAIFLFIVGLLTFSAIHFISTRTRLFLSMERALLNGFFFLREYDVHEQNPLVSDQVMLLGYDEESLAVIGKWPWKRHVHANFLDKIEQFSPRSIMIDILFIKPETVPLFISKKFESDPRIRRKVEDAFAEMDGKFAEALEKYNNVYLDLQLVEQPRSGLTEFYRNRIRINEQIIKDYSQPMENNKSPVVFHSLEPTLTDFLKHAHPAVINVLPDDDGMTRSFPLYYTYRMSDGSYRNIFTVVLSLLQRYYRIGKNDITIKNDRVIINSAKTPILNKDTHQEVLFIKDFDKISTQIKNPSPPKGYEYNKNLFKFLVNQFSLGVKTTEKIPFFPLHILRKDDKGLEILDGWEVYDAAKMSGSKKIQVVFYKETDMDIETPLTGFYYINFAGREKTFYLDSETGKPSVFTAVPTGSYSDVYTMDDLPDIPELDSSGKIKPGYDTPALEKWFYGYCEEKTLELYEKVKRDLGVKAQDEKSLLDYMNKYPEEGKYFFYFNFFTNVPQTPGAFKTLVGAYPDFGREVGQAPEYFLSEKQMLLSLMDFYREQFQRYYNKFIFTGATARGLGDQQQTPYGTMSGINTIINAFNTIITQNLLKMSSDIPNLDLLILLCLSMLCSFVYGLSSVRVSSLIFVVLLLGAFVTSFTLFNNSSLFLKTTPLLFSNIIVFVAIIIFKVLTEQKDKKFLKSTFSSYLAPEIIDEMYRSKTMPRLGGEARPITAFFTDIQGFSTFSEKLTAGQLVELINEYLSTMTNILIADRGTLDKYEGDAIIAFFGAPMAVPDHALRACRVALSMQNSLADLCKKWRNQKQGPDEPDRNTKGLPPEEWVPGEKWPKIVQEMKMRIGVNTGEIIVGNMGSATRMNYTMMGDPVNVTARLEAAGKQYGVYLLVSEHTLEQAVPGEGEYGKKVIDMVEARFIDKFTVIGKSEPVKVYELCAMKGDLSEQEKALFDVFDRGMGHYLKMEWDKAIFSFKESLKLERIPDGKTTPSQVYIRRCESFKKNPPVADPAQTWDGVYRLTQK
jgi:class 3 adenylate cyclase/CHASE2 domain-containing sensor protein